MNYPVFKNYISNLSDYEILVVFKYRSSEINSENLQSLNQEVQKRNLSIDVLKKLQKEEIKKNKKMLICPRCKTTKVVEILDDKIEGWPLMDLAFKYASYTLKNQYRCELCANEFSKWPKFSELLKRYFKNLY